MDENSNVNYHVYACVNQKGGVGKSVSSTNLGITLMGEAEEPTAANGAVTESSAFSISQQIIDEVLTSGGNELDSTLRIAAYFKKDHSVAENAYFLMEEYRRFEGDGGKGFLPPFT